MARREPCSTAWFSSKRARPNGPAARLLIDFVERGRLTLYVSDPIIEELRDVLGRPRIRAKNPAITDDTVEEFCNRLRRVGQESIPSPQHLRLPATLMMNLISISPLPRRRIIWLRGTRTCST